MKRIAPLIAIVVASVGFTLFASANAGCFRVRQHEWPSVTTASDKLTMLQIEGMTCGACAAAVKQVLRNVDGVKDARVSYEEKNAVVTYDARKVTPVTIVRVLMEKLPAYRATVIK